jgi:protein-tyrosine phosphatase
MNILFICSRNKKRSLTAETVFKKDTNNSIRSAGTEDGARIKVTEKLVNWADLIFVMEKKHKQRIMSKFSHTLYNKEIITLDIPDIYEYMDEELVEILEGAVRGYLELEK